MQKYVSYVLPVGALLVLTVLGVKLLRNTPPQPQITENAEGIDITDLTGQENVQQGAKDLETVKLTPKAELASGDVRYSRSPEGDVNFTVVAMLPKLKSDESYQVWFEGEKGMKKAMKLIEGKGGYTGQGTISSEFNQVSVVVSKEKQDDAVIEEKVLEGQLPLQNNEER